ncbi:hypothetical protein BW686_18665 [Pseudomonas syringae]|uniref:Uncharacterized protein n=1 Tax=Pseudomonas syringae TaxID=317 RepID=A0A244EN51_PSESX|nr:hypothetical protein [Pseudomonas syringae]OUM05959.1 hypothetical protein BW686_18665 [Pseudomonas syringae]
MDSFMDAQALLALTTPSSAAPTDCSCLQRDLAGWSSWPVGYHEEAFKKLGTLAQYSPEEATIDEYHPEGTLYWSPDAPIAPRYYPYNQSTVWQCDQCRRIYLRHNDDGAYHVERRIRLVQPHLITDAQHANEGRDAGC